jgi:predicted PurR-regulated permease PerM
MSEKAKNTVKKILLSLIPLALFTVSLLILHKSAAGSFLLIVGTILTVPIDEWQDWLGEKFSRKWIQYLVVVALCALAIVLALTAKEHIYTIDQSPELMETIEDLILEQDPDILDEIGKTE